MTINSVRRLTLQLLSLSIASNLAWAEPPRMGISIGDVGVTVSEKEAGVVVSESDAIESDPPSLVEVAGEVETVRERFKNGKVRIEKNVTLDADGNFVTHGMFTEWNEKGDLVQTGTYKNGKRDGAWIKICQATQSKLFDSFPYNKFKAPFQSTVEFVDGEMNGVWSITDANDRVVSHISIEKGLRNGRAIWNLPSGMSAYEADYENGVLHGQFVEKDATGKVAKQLDYDKGCVRQLDKETFPNKQPKSEINVLSGKAKLVSKDDYESLNLATYVPDGEPIRDGAFVFYHENGTVRTRGTFKRGEVHGSFEVWHSNGERECVGTFQTGKQVGKWTWWHANGMRKSSGEYANDVLQGEMLAWDEKGKRVTSTNLEPPIELAKSKPEPTERAPRTSGRIRPASVLVK